MICNDGGCFVLYSNLKNAIKDVAGAVLYCIKLSCKASAFYTIVRIITRFFISFSAIFLTFLTSKTISALTMGVAKEQLKSDVIFLFALILFVNIAQRVLNELDRYCTHLQNMMLSHYMNMYIMEKMANIDIECYDSPAFYDTMEAVKRDNYVITTVLWNVFDAISSMVAFCGIFVVVSSYKIWFALVIFLAIIPSAVINQRYTKFIYNWDLKNIKEQRSMGYIQSIVSSRNHAMEIRLYDIGDYLIKKYSNAWKVFLHKKRNILKEKTRFIVVLVMLPEICMVGIMLYLAFGILEGRNTIGDYTLYSGLLGQLLMNVITLVNAFNNIYEDRLRINNIRSFEKIKSVIQDTGKRSVEGDVSIEFRNVSFKYPGTEKMILDNVSFRIGKREKACIVGINGAGKSTIMKLVLRFYDATEGEILINDVNIKEYEISSLRKCFNAFFQDVSNYSFTVRENISISDYSNREKNDEDIYECLGNSEALEMVRGFPKGLGQYVTKSFDEDGVELSGGQYQKLALARMFYRDSKVVLLDEPSASLDPEAEYKLFDFLTNYCENKTAIFTSHRLSNIHLAEYIILLEEGKVVEKGSHEELMKNDSRYAQLYHYQADKYMK